MKREQREQEMNEAFLFVCDKLDSPTCLVCNKDSETVICDKCMEIAFDIDSHQLMIMYLAYESQHEVLRSTITRMDAASRAAAFCNETMMDFVNDIQLVIHEMNSVCRIYNYELQKRR